MWNLPFTVNIDGEEHAIRNKCDYRVILDCMMAFNDPDLNTNEKILCAFAIFYEQAEKITNYNDAVSAMFKIINHGQKEDNKRKDEDGGSPAPPMMDWEYDWALIAPAVSQYLGYEIRDPDKFTHWFTFLGAYTELKDCTFTTVTTIRAKRRQGVKLEDHELRFANSNPNLINIPTKLSLEEQYLLENDW